MRIVVLGGTGFLGSRAVAALSSLPGVEVSVASRRGPLRVDLADPSTFAAVEGADVVVDVADATRSPPDALAAFCLERGIAFVETTSDREVVERLATTLAARSGEGAVVLGAGIFTGLSNLLAAAAARAAGACRSLSLAVRSSPYSGAGASTVELMRVALRTDTVAFVDGERRLGPPVAPGPRISFPSGEAPTLEAPLAEPFMLHASTKAPNVRAYLSIRPALLVALFRALPRALLSSWFFGAFVGFFFGVLRRFVLRRVASTVDLVAIAEGERRVVRSLQAPDGMATGGAAIAAIAVEVARVRPRGVKQVDEVVDLDAVLETMRPLPGGEVRTFGP